MAKPKRLVVEVRFIKGEDGGWSGWSVRPRGAPPVADYRTRVAAIEEARYTCRSSWRDGGEPAQMVVYTKRGTVSFESTYGLDPRRRKG